MVQYQPIRWINYHPVIILSISGIRTEWYQGTRTCFDPNKNHSATIHPAFLPFTQHFFHPAWCGSSGLFGRGSHDRCPGLGTADVLQGLERQQGAIWWDGMVAKNRWVDPLVKWHSQFASHGKSLINKWRFLAGKIIYGPNRNRWFTVLRNGCDFPWRTVK